MGISSNKDRSRRAETSARRRLSDRFAKYFVTIGGLAIIACVLGIFVFILGEVMPLFAEATVAPGRFLSFSSPPRAVLTDEYQTWCLALEDRGIVKCYDLAAGREAPEFKIDGLEGQVYARAAAKHGGFHVVLADGRECVAAVKFNIDFKGSVRVVTPIVQKPAIFEFGAKGPSDASDARIGPEGARGLAAVSGDKLIYLNRSVTKNEMTGEVEDDISKTEAAAPANIRRLAVDLEGQNVYGATRDGELARWRIQNNKLEPADRVKVGGAPVSALGFLLGDQSLLVGQEDGGVSVWFLVGRNTDSKILTRIRDFKKHPLAVTRFEASTREKSFFSLDAGGGLRLAHSTSERILWEGRSPVADPSGILYTPKADGLFVYNTETLAVLDIHNPHPETSVKALFGKVWYENNIEPEYSWQSSSSSNDVEPKLSLVPIVYGTLKGTFYSLLLAIPAAVLAAMYTSQFLSWGLRRFVKPIVEIMASLPSVVIGFLAGLWLAPRVASGFVAIISMILMVPVSIVAAGFIGRILPKTFRARFPQGTEIPCFMIAIAAGAWLAMLSSGPVESALFGGNFQAWLLRTTGAEYNQNNAIVVGMAMGFAVIPIIFAVAEDAFSNVPKTLISASLALGANRWQTVTRVVLPTASPGIFSGIMIGFGRAVGETMIVVMATGVTAIMDWSPFNGFRTLSANIANEIPEAPHGGTLYRILFLSGLLLFGFTFIINTAAELVRQRLRSKYSTL